MGVVCKLNNINLEFSQEELINFGLDVASGNMDTHHIKKWIINHIVNKK